MNKRAIQNVVKQAGLIAIIVAAGLGSRRFAAQLPGFVGAYAGDTLYAVLVFVLWRTFFSSWTMGRIVVITLGFCFAIELSQLYQAPWAQAVRATLPGRLVLGQGFLWSDFLCYAVGVMAAVLLTLVSGRIRP
ncbi:MAG: DUF2809 domain-containing protein [Algisphaera sp.]